MKVYYEKGMTVPLKVWTDDIDYNSLEQAKMLARMPFVFHHVAAMPDIHLGKGCPIGSVFATDGYVVPNCVSVDQGCGVSVMQMPFDFIDIDQFMNRMVELVPVGNSNRDINSKYTDSLRDEAVNKLIERAYDLNDSVALRNTFKGRLGMIEAMLLQCGTLGGGNHFFEVQKDENGNIWFMVHSGSRGFGAKVADFYHKIAVATCEKYKSQLESPDLAYLPMDSKEGYNYWQAMQIGIDYAYENRMAMMRAAITAVSEQVGSDNTSDRDWDVLNIPHNYAAIENHFGKNVVVHRKGATLVREGKLGIIPGSMTTHSYIVIGKGNPDSFHSCSHGSGRSFSRSEAKRRVLNGEDLSAQDQLDLSNVKVYGSNSFNDELGSAYKDIDNVMNNQTDLCEIVHKLTPVATLKG